MSKMDELAQQVSELRVEVERRFGQMRSCMLLLGLAILLSIGPEDPVGSLIIAVIGKG